MTDAADRLYERLLVLRCQAGDDAAFAELVGRYGPRLAYYLRKMLGPDADDALQEVWLDVVRGVGRLADPGAFPAWLYPVARARVLRVRRLTIATFITWLLAVVMVLGISVGFGLLMPMQAKISTYIQKGQIPAAEREQVQLKAQQMSSMLTVMIALSVGMLALAALCTVLLVLASRRATLRQINASLITISEQLKQLRPGDPRAGTPPG